MGGGEGEGKGTVISSMLLPVSWKQPETWLRCDSCPVCSSWPKARLVARGGKKDCCPIKWKCVWRLNLETVRGAVEITPAGGRACYSTGFFVLPYSSWLLNFSLCSFPPFNPFREIAMRKGYECHSSYMPVCLGLPESFVSSRERCWEKRVFQVAVTQGSGSKPCISLLLIIQSI